jgi:uncharacterized protein YjiS (DUF1127 family)
MEVFEMGTIDAINAEQVAIRPKIETRRLSPGTVTASMIAWIVTRSEKRRSRSVLRDLTDDQLRDVGLTRSDVRREAAKSFFWD